MVGVWSKDSEENRELWGDFDTRDESILFIKSIDETEKTGLTFILEDIGPDPSLDYEFETLDELTIKE